MTSGQGVILLPNPAAGIVSLEAAFPISTVRVIDLNGKEVLRHQLEGGQNQFRFNVDALSRGMYMVEVADTEGRVRLTRLMKH